MKLRIGVFMDLGKIQTKQETNFVMNVNGDEMGKSPNTGRRTKPWSLRRPVITVGWLSERDTDTTAPFHCQFRRYLSLLFLVSSSRREDFLPRPSRREDFNNDNGDADDSTRQR